MPKICDLPPENYSLEDVLDCDDCSFKNWDKVLNSLLRDNRFNTWQTGIQNLSQLWKAKKINPFNGLALKNLVEIIRGIIQVTQPRNQSLIHLDDPDG